MDKIYLKDYQAPDFEVDFVNLEFDLAPDEVTVTNRMTLKSLRPGKPLILDGEKLKLVTIAIDGKILGAGDYTLSEETLTLPKVPGEFELTIKTQFNPKENTELNGLYYSGGFLCTQCEAQGFRRITYFLDRPDVMTTYHVTLRADKKQFPILLSNGNRFGEKDLPGGRHQAEWEDPFKKPCYLFALVAGDLGVIRDSFLTMNDREINLEIYAPHGKQSLCQHAMRSLKHAMKWDEERFGREYDLDDYMIVSIDDFNMGAMENKGLNIFNSRLVLADENTATDADFHRIESVVAHEYFHNWTGNRVTLRDWFHLSLKEGLTVFRDQEFSADRTDASIQRINDVNLLRERQFTEDAGPNSHPVRPESCYAVDNFYTATIYEKGAEVIRMMSTMVGKLGFRNGMDVYFSRHDGQAVTIEDFVKAITEPNKKNWDQFRYWYSQAGTPQVEVSESYDSAKQEYSVRLKQSSPATPGQSNKKPFHIPLTFEIFDRSGKIFDVHSDQISRNSEGQKIIELATTEAEYKFAQIPARPILSLMRQFSAPVNLKWNRPDEDLLFLMTKDDDGFNRREAALSMGLKYLKQILTDFRQGQNPQALPAYTSAFKLILEDESISPAFKALMIRLPSEKFLIQKEDLFDAENFYKTQEWAYANLGKTFASQFQNIYQKFHGKDAKAIDMVAAGHRNLKNTALIYWVQSQSSAALDAAVQQYKSAQNMTDRIAALAALTTTQHPEFENLLTDFYRTWKNDTLVMNKWFAIQASAPRPDTYQRVKGLLNHPDFSIKNPNNVYSVIGDFINNASLCHSRGGDIYDFLTDQILKIDEINPQVGARICGIFDYYSKMPAEQKALLKAQAERALKHPKLSKNTRELIEPVIAM